MDLITTTRDLKAACATLDGARYVTIDTEFMRDSTYWPVLCVLQFAGPEEGFVVDAMAKGIDLSPFYEVLKNEAITKVFHAARQDLEIFYHQGNVIPAPLFDTQVAAMACGFGSSIAYDSLVKRIAKVDIDKGPRFTDWSRRPLSKAQIEYALADVIHLRPVYERLQSDLARKKRKAWLREEMRVLEDPATYNLDPKDAWRRLKIKGAGRHNLGVLIEVAAWREREAQRHDVPRNRILKDDAIRELVNQKPGSQEALKKLRLVPKSLATSSRGNDLIDAIRRGKEAPKSSLPKLDLGKGPQPKNDALVDLLKVLLKHQCSTQCVATILGAKVQDLEAIAASEDADVPALKGWRLQVFGSLALKLKRQEIALGVGEDGVRVLSLDER